VKMLADVSIQVARFMCLTNRRCFGSKKESSRHSCILPIKWVCRFYGRKT